MKHENISKLFAPIELNNMSLNNRIVMAPMTRSRAIGNIPNSLITEYYRQRAVAGLVITEGVSPSPNGLGYPRIPGIFSREQVAAWKEVTDAVHGQGGKIFLQIMHTGRISHTANMPAGSVVLAPSSVAAKGELWTDAEGMQPFSTPREMSLADIKTTTQEFVTAASNAISAGFDGVELHGANGYLLEQFLNPFSNTRTDAYGGSLENRLRFPLELTAAVIAEIGKEKVGYRISPYGTYNDMPLYDEIPATYLALASGLREAGIAYLHVIEPALRQHDPALLHTLRKTFPAALMLNGGYTSDSAHEALEAGLADLVSFGAPFVANPDLPHRLQNGIPLAQPDPSLFFTAGAEGYTDYTTSARAELIADA